MLFLRLRLALVDFSADAALTVFAFCFAVVGPLLKVFAVE